MIEAPNRPRLADVTLVAVTSVALEATVEALHKSMTQADFGEILLLSDSKPAGLAEAITWRRIEPLQSRFAYSRFMLQRLGQHIGTSHALCIQWDSFVLNGHAWRQEFLDFDYIGAPWPHFHDGYNVGNGGFSLRSRRLLEACATLPQIGGELEDVLISRVCRPLLEAQGIRFAPEELARLFSYERMNPTGDEFGFHGAFNLVDHLAPPDASRILSSLEAGLLARNERRELLNWALRKGQVRLALNMLGRLIRT